jgi:hypothetical protein
MEIMKRRPATWIEDLYNQKIPISLALTQEKALSLQEDIWKLTGDKEAEKETSVASKGWLHRFKNHYGFKNLKIEGEIASAITDAAEAFPELKITDEEGNSPKQIFSVDKTELYQKRMISRMYISEKEKSAFGFKASKDCVTMLVAGNANGDKKLRPMLMY